ncbi:hypothetical protein [Kutzneria kofuensis]|uniref:Protein kinase domain-containing protein n=1 Tax=Kutzneria kofuensis TaxID=103725 RepID=A0A7W9KLL4_9PSEU|nr:hypothetical protein [Kutzneria kofuensis]MBB5894838.1 hypothetical protein [Kutzneria kofuensis]
MTWRLPAVVTLDEIGPLAGTISDAAGQSTGIHPLDDHPGWLAKLYRTPGGAADAKRLDDLIALPVDGLLRDATSWPVARIAADEKTLGCVIPTAPDRFRRDDGVWREIDWLAKPDHLFVRRGLTVPTRADRLSICRNLVDVAAALERHELVYSDWSYSNAFWCDTDGSVFVIDIDGCGPGPVPNIFQPNWDDPLTRRPMLADACTDRYRVALLVTRCLTGERELPLALNALADSDGLGNRGLREVLLDILLSTDRERRPSLSDLATVIAGGLYVSFGPRPERIALPPRPIVSAPKEPEQPPDAEPTPAESRQGVVAVVVVLLLILAIFVIAALAH